MDAPNEFDGCCLLDRISASARCLRSTATLTAKTATRPIAWWTNQHLGLGSAADLDEDIREGLEEELEEMIDEANDD